MRKWLVSGIIVLAFLLRVVGLSDYPTGFTADEASFGYDAYSVLKTGKDQWGESFPLAFRSFGDFKLPVYAYIAIPSVAIFGLNEFAVRLPSALLGTLAVFFTYLMVKVMFKGRKFGFNNGELALFAALLLAISPWHVSLSRGAFEANLTSFFIPLALWAFFQGLKKPRWMIVSAFVLGLNLFTYHSARFFTPLLVVSLIFLEPRLSKRTIKKEYKIAMVVFSLFIILAGYSVLKGAGARGMDVAIFNPTGGWAAVADRRYEAILQGVPGGIARIFSNKVIYLFDKFVENYLSYFSPQFLFTQGVTNWTYGMIPGEGVLYLIELPFLMMGMWYIFKQGLRKTYPSSLILIWILLAPIPAALTKGSGYAGNRAAVMMPAIQVLSAFGIVAIYHTLLSKWKNFGKRLLSAISIVLLASLVFFLENYFYHAPMNVAPDMLYGRREAVGFVASVEEQYRRIFFSRSLTEPQIFVAFYKKWDPHDYQRQTETWLEYERQNLPFLDQLDHYDLGKYRFGSLYYQRNKEEGVLFVGKPEDFEEQVVPLKTIYYPSAEPAILIVDPASQIYAKANQ